MFKEYKHKLDPDKRTRSRNVGGGVIFKVRATRNGFGAKWIQRLILVSKLMNWILS